jgi:hypothetical protein
MSGDQNAGRSQNIKTNYSLERAEPFIYSGTTLAYQNSIQEEMSCRLRECFLSFGAESFVF